MGDTMSCEECGNEAKSSDDLEKTEVAEITVDTTEVNQKGKKDLFLCKECKKPMGVGHS